MKAIAMFLLLSLVGCYDPRAQESAVVREVEAAGAGNLNTYTQPGLAQWFSTRSELARKIAGECGPIAGNRGANWATSAEGTVCLAANRAQPLPQWTADQRTW